MDKLRQGKIIIKNWHALQWDTEERLKKKKSVDKVVVLKAMKLMSVKYWENFLLQKILL